jgi:hypothetical protein
VASIAQPVIARGRLRAAIGWGARFIGNLILFAGIALLGGLGTSWYMVENGSRFTTVRAGPWVSWKHAAAPDADPYTRARAARHGGLPLGGNVARTFEARTDEAGERLHSGCDYVIEGRLLDESWWTIAVYDEHGRLIPNPAERYGYNASTIARAADNSFLITLARDARPGNWLPAGQGVRLVLVLTLLEGSSADLTEQGRLRLALPTIQKVSCR